MADNVGLLRHKCDGGNCAGLVAGGHHGASQGDVAESFQPASGTVSSQGLIRSGQPGVSPLLVPDIRNIFTDKAEVKLIPGKGL